MSIKLMDKAWESGYDTGPKFVLLALCDNANDQGFCWPSISTIARKCGMTERSVYNHLNTLADAVTKVERPGKPTVYQIDPCKFFTPEIVSPLKNFQGTPEIVSNAYIGEPPKNRHTPKAPRQPAVAAPEGVEVQVWSDFKKLRARLRAEVTQTVLDGIKREATKAGISMQEALVICCERGWRGFKADWLHEPARPGFAAPGAVTVPSRPGIDPAIAKVIADAAKAAPPPAHIRERMAQLTRKQTNEA